MNDRFEQARTFVAIVQGKGFNAAAQQLGLVKSAVSRRLGELEDRLGSRLLNRTTRGVTLTETGTNFYDRCIRLLDDLEEAETMAAKGSVEAIGRLRISAPVSFTIRCLAPALKQLMDQYPKLVLEIDTNDRKVDLVSEGYDVALRISQLKESSLVARRLSPIRHAVCASPAYFEQHGRPQTPEELRTHVGIAYSYVDSRSYWRFKDNVVVDVPSPLQLSNGDAIREAAIDGCGIAFLPSFIIHEAVAAGQLEVVLKEYIRPPIDLSVVYASHRNVSTKVRCFIDFCIAHFAEEPYWDRAIFGASRQ